MAEQEVVVVNKFKAKYCAKECQYLVGANTNMGDFCELKYTQNPADVKGILNVMKNGGKVCGRAKDFLKREQLKQK